MIRSFNMGGRYHARPARPVATAHRVAINSQQRILDHINSAKSTLDLALLYLDDTDVRSAIIAAQSRGVAALVFEPSAVAPIASQFETDWAGGR
jgi:phosphatidylserine/phosphatidylglycerophosphate/cardiolipin synthase-like enzyme